MKHPRLTKTRFESLHPADQLAAYCRHPDNQKFNPGSRPDGLSFTAQAELWNDWRSAFGRFHQALPNR